MHNRILLLICLLSSSLHSSFGQSQEPGELIIHARNRAINIEREIPKLWLLSDPTTNYTIETIQKDIVQEKFTLSNIERGQLSSSQVYWMKLKLKSNLYRDSEWILSLGLVSNADVFLFYEKDRYTWKKAGQFVTYSERDVKTGRFNSVDVYLPAQQELEIYIRFFNQVNYPPDLNARLIPKNTWMEKNIGNGLVQGFFQGLLWMMLVYSLFLYFTVGDQTYFYYALYILTTSLYWLNFYGYWGELFWGSLPSFNYLYMPFTVYLGILLYLEFMRYYLQTQKNAPKWDNAIRVAQYLFAGITIFQIILATLSYEHYWILEKYINTGFFIVLLIITAFIFSFGDLVAQYFAAGTASMFIGGTILLLGSSRFFDIPYNDLIYQLGIIGEIGIFALGLSERYKISESDKRIAQRDFIEQLEENRKLQTKVNRELEQKVRERTNKIERQNKEILLQSEEIEMQKALLEETNQILADKNQHITDSIIYASRIQEAILYDYRVIEHRFKDAFIFYTPKDIVSGDFFWYSELLSDPIIQSNRATSTQEAIRPANRTIDNLQNVQLTPKLERSYGSGPENPLPEVSKISLPGKTKALPQVVEYNQLKIIAVADCTGHGVPGAFMTVMGNDFLHEIVNKGHITDPAQILTELDRKVVHTLRKTQEIHQISDGMDIGILIYDEKNQILSFSGAVHPLYLVREYEIQTFKSARFSIGYSSYYKSKKFETVKIKVQPDDVFYMSSDGFQDQFGGPHGAKYLRKKFRKLLLNISHLPMAEQKRRLAKELKDWMRAYPQTDDILVLGIKF